MSGLWDFIPENAVQANISGDANCSPGADAAEFLAEQYWNGSDD